MPSTQMRDVKDIKDLVLEQSMDPKVGRSEVNLSRRKFMNGDIGMIMPIDLIPVIPGDNFNLSCNYIINTEALQVVPFTRYKVRVHYYYSDLNSLWKGAQTFVTKGRNYSIDLKIPTWKNSGNGPMNCSTETSLSQNKKICLNSPLSLNAFMKVPSTVFHGASKTANQVDSYLPFCRVDGTKDTDWFETGYNLPSKLNLLPYLMYQKIYRFNYLANNLMQSNKIWFPDDMADEWRISYSGDNVSCLLDSKHECYDNVPYFVPSSSPLPKKGNVYSSFIPIASGAFADNCVNLFLMRYCMYGNDIFTTALPWLTRGSEPTVDTTLSAVDNFVRAQFADSDNTRVGGSVFSEVADGSKVLNFDTREGTLGLKSVYKLRTSASSSDTYGAAQLSVGPNVGDRDRFLGVNFGGINAKMVLTANQIRNLLALSVFQERNAITNGDYNSFIRAHYGLTPKQPDYEPKYIGGTSSYIDFTEVIQTSESGTTPQGRQTGLGFNVNEGFIGHFQTNDFGYIMAVMMITPEVSYTQGLEHWQFDDCAEDLYFPERANLSFQPVLNKQIFVSGDANDDDLFGYSTRYAYLKQRDDCVTGLLALPPKLFEGANTDLLMTAYTQARVFDTCPKLSQQFLTVSPNNVRRDFMFAPSQPLFRIQIASNVRGSRCIPWSNTPNTFGF
nr:MAG TPA: Major capsid protein [Microviridae sp.]